MGGACPVCYLHTWSNHPEVPIIIIVEDILGGPFLYNTNIVFESISSVNFLTNVLIQEGGAPGGPAVSSVTYIYIFN